MIGGLVGSILLGIESGGIIWFDGIALLGGDGEESKHGRALRGEVGWIVQRGLETSSFMMKP